MHHVHPLVVEDVGELYIALALGCAVPPWVTKSLTHRNLGALETHLFSTLTIVNS